MSELVGQTMDFLQNNHKIYSRIKSSGDPIKPVGISIAVTGRCNSRCMMCSIWKHARKDLHRSDHEMQLMEIIDLLNDPFLDNLVEIDITGGEPFLRDDLAEIIIAIAELKKSVLPRLRTIIVPSNGLLTEKVLQQTESILTHLKHTGIDFVSVISMEGPESVHDTIRGIQGAHEKTSRTIEGLMELKAAFAGFYWPGIKTTISRYNADLLESTFDFASGKGLFSIISGVIITQSRFCNIKYRDRLELGPEELEKIRTFYASGRLEHDFYACKIKDSIISGSRQWTCTAGFNYVFIDFNKKVYPCPIQDACLGDLTHDSFSAIMTGKKARRIRQQVGAYPLCRQCTEPGTVRYSQIQQGEELLNFLQAGDMDRFREAVLEHGLHKFFE